MEPETEFGMGCGSVVVWKRESVKAWKRGNVET